MSVPEPLTRKIELFRKTGRVLEDDGDLFKEVAWVQVMLGQGINPEHFHPLAERISDKRRRFHHSSNPHRRQSRTSPVPFAISSARNIPLHPMYVAGGGGNVTTPPLQKMWQLMKSWNLAG